MTDALTNIGLLYEAKDDAKLEARIQLSLQIVEMNVLTKKRAVQTRIEAKERTNQTRFKAEKMMAKRANFLKFLMEQFMRDIPR